MVQNAILVPDGPTASTTSKVTVSSDVVLTLATGTDILIPAGTTFTSATTTDFTIFDATNTINTSDLSQVMVNGALQFGLPDFSVTVNPAITIHINVGSNLNGQTLDIYRKDANGSWIKSPAGTDPTCVVSSGICTFTTTHLSDFAVGTATVSTPVVTPTASRGGGASGQRYLTLKTITATASTSTATSSSISSYQFTKDLKVGSKGTAVIELQKILVSQGYLVIPKGDSMGYFGKATKAAVIKYQIKNGIKPSSGKVGPLTRASLNKANNSLTDFINLLIKLGIISSSKLSA